MTRSIFAALALTLFAAAIAPALSLGGTAEAACTRVYTTSGWITRC